jgi:AbiV family abortive infection protein
LEDAKLLVSKGSYGHANALLRFSAEELVKTLVCWQVSEKIIPEDCKPYRDVFKNHVMKNEVIIGFFRPPRISTGEMVDNKIMKWWDKMKMIPKMMEERRKSCVYVDRSGRDGKIHTPLEIGRKETEGLLRYVEGFFGFMKSVTAEDSLEFKKRLKEAYSSLPRDVWKTGGIPREYFGKPTKGVKS